jgi:Skp family chaperone for outer membrane proteins
MREMVFPALVLGALLAAPAGAQEAAKPAAPPAATTGARAPKIGILDIDRVWAESLLGKGYTAQLEKSRNELQSLGTKKETELKKLQDEIQALAEDIEKQQAVLSPDILEGKQRVLVKKRREAEDFIADGKQEVNKEQQRLQLQQQQFQNEFLDKVRPSVETVVREKGLDVLFDKRSTYLLASKDFDVTQDVIVKVDDAEKLKKAAGPAATTPKPAAGSPAPGPKPAAPTPGPVPPSPKP